MYAGGYLCLMGVNNNNFRIPDFGLTFVNPIATKIGRLVILIQLVSLCMNLIGKGFVEIGVKF